MSELETGASNPSLSLSPSLSEEVSRLAPHVHVPGRVELERENAPIHSSSMDGFSRRSILQRSSSKCSEQRRKAISDSIPKLLFSSHLKAVVLAGTYVHDRIYV
jgi:hypothetical protein